MTGVQVWKGEWICCWISPGLAVVVKLGPSHGLSITGRMYSNWPGLRHRPQLYLHTRTHTLLLSLGLFWLWVFFLCVTSIIDFFGGAGEQEKVGPTGSESDFSRRSCAKSRYSRGLHLHGEPFTWGPDQVFIHVSLVPLWLLRASSWMQRTHVLTVVGRCQPKQSTKLQSKSYLCKFLTLKVFLITERIYRTRAFQICGLVWRHFQHHLFILSHQSFSAGREARVCGVPHGPELPGCTGALGFSHRQR